MKFTCGADVAGKTLSYAIPLVQHLQSKSPHTQRSDGPYALVIVPTREVSRGGRRVRGSGQIEGGGARGSWEIGSRCVTVFIIFYYGAAIFLPAMWRHNMAQRRIIFSPQLWHLHSSLLLSYKYNGIAVSCCDKQHLYVLIVCWWPNEGAWPFAMALCLWHDNIFYFICDIGIRSFNLFVFLSWRCKVLLRFRNWLGYVYCFIL